jgi:hypothetical protein
MTTTPTALTLDQLNTLSAELVMTARGAILDCRTEPVVEWLMGLDDGQARQLLQAVAYLAGGLAVQLDEHATPTLEALRGWQKGASHGG